MLYTILYSVLCEVRAIYLYSLICVCCVVFVCSVVSSCVAYFVMCCFFYCGLCCAVGLMCGVFGGGDSVVCFKSCVEY